MGNITSMGNHMRKLNKSFFLLSTIALMLLTVNLQAQRNLTLYQLHSNAQTYNLNPGRIPLNKYQIGLPLVSSLNGNLSSTGFKWGDFERDTTPEGLTINPFKKFLDLLDQENQVFADASTNLFDLGFRLGKKNYIQLHAAEQMTMAFSYPRTLAEMLFNVGENKNVARAYDIQTLRLSGLHFRSYGLGFSRQISNNFSAGVKVKFIQGISNIQSYNDSMRFVSDKDDRYFGVLGNLSFYGSGLAGYRNAKTLLLPTQGNTGLGFDFGFQWSVNEKIDLYGSAINIGSITWDKATTVNPIADDDIEFPTRFLDEFASESVEFTERLGRDHPVDTSYTTALPTTIYLGGSYFINEKLSVDALLNPRLFMGQMDFGFSVGLTARLNKTLEVGANLSSFNKSTINFGLGASANLGPVQLFVATDNALAAFSPKNARNVHLNAGMSFCFGRQSREERIAELEGKADPKAEKEKLAANKQAKTLSPSALLPTVSLIGSVFNALNREQLSGVVLEMFSVKPDGEELPSMKRTFGAGIISIDLQRTQNYRLIVHKSGFESQQITVSPDEMAGLNILKKEFFLNGGQAPVKPKTSEPLVVQPVSTPKTEPANAQSFEPVTPRIEMNGRVNAKASQDVNETGGKTKIVYRVISPSVIKAGPGEQYANLLPVVIGHRLELLETKGEWRLVRFRDYVGYLPARLLELEE
jgi:Family of unknown function (DUF5723)